MDETTRSAFLGILMDRKQFCRWAEFVDSIRREEDLPDFRECFDVPKELSSKEAKRWILADAMQTHYTDICPDLETPFREILFSGLNDKLGG